MTNRTRELTLKVEFIEKERVMLVQICEKIYKKDIKWPNFTVISEKRIKVWPFWAYGIFWTHGSLRSKIVRVVEDMLKRERKYRHLTEGLLWDARGFSGGQWITEDYRLSDYIKKHL